MVPLSREVAPRACGLFFLVFFVKYTHDPSCADTIRRRLGLFLSVSSHALVRLLKQAQLGGG